MRMHQYKKTSNGIAIQFRSRYRQNTYFNVYLPGDRETQELREGDDGTIEMAYSRQPSPEVLQAFAEYREAERADFEQYKKDNASLFV